MATDLATKGANNPEMVAHVQNLGILKEGSAERRHTPRPTNPFPAPKARARGATTPQNTQAITTTNVSATMESQR